MQCVEVDGEGGWWQELAHKDVAMVVGIAADEVGGFGAKGYVTAVGGHNRRMAIIISGCATGVDAGANGCIGHAIINENFTQYIITPCCACWWSRAATIDDVTAVV